MKGHTWRFFLCLAITGLPYAVIPWLIGFLASYIPHSFVTLFFTSLVQVGVSFFFMVPMLAVIAYVFKKLPESPSEY